MKKGYNIFTHWGLSNEIIFVVDSTVTRIYVGIWKMMVSFKSLIEWKKWTNQKRKRGERDPRPVFRTFSVESTSDIRIDGRGFFLYFSLAGPMDSKLISTTRMYTTQRRKHRASTIEDINDVEPLPSKALHHIENLRESS